MPIQFIGQPGKEEDSLLARSAAKLLTEAGLMGVKHLSERALQKEQLKAAEERQAMVNEAAKERVELQARETSKRDAIKGMAEALKVLHKDPKQGAEMILTPTEERWSSTGGGGKGGGTGLANAMGTLADKFGREIEKNYPALEASAIKSGGGVDVQRQRDARRQWLLDQSKQLSQLAAATTAKEKRANRIYKSLSKGYTPEQKQEYEEYLRSIEEDRRRAQGMVYRYYKGYWESLHADDPEKFEQRLEKYEQELMLGRNAETIERDNVRRVAEARVPEQVVPRSKRYARTKATGGAKVKKVDTPEKARELLKVGLTNRTDYAGSDMLKRAWGIVEGTGDKMETPAQRSQVRRKAILKASAASPEYRSFIKHASGEQYRIATDTATRESQSTREAEAKIEKDIGAGLEKYIKVGSQQEKDFAIKLITKALMKPRDVAVFDELVAEQMKKDIGGRIQSHIGDAKYGKWAGGLEPMLDLYFSPKRVKAYQKLVEGGLPDWKGTSLEEGRFRDLSVDVFFDVLQEHPGTLAGIADAVGAGQTMNESGWRRTLQRVYRDGMGLSMPDIVKLLKGGDLKPGRDNNPIHWKLKRLMEGNFRLKFHDYNFPATSHPAARGG